MEYKIMHIPISPKTRQGVKITPTGITIHSTANPKSTAINERNWLVNPSNTRTASWHIAVDENMAVEAIPLNEKAIHASSTMGNNTTIGIEICESGNREKTLKNAVALVAKMLHERNWSVDRLKRHFDWNGKNCPRIFNYNNWEGWAKFKNDVQAELNRLKGVDNMFNIPTPKPQINNNQPSAWAKESWDWAVREKLFDGSNPKENITREQVATIIHRLFLQGRFR